MIDDDGSDFSRVTYVVKTCPSGTPLLSQPTSSSYLLCSTSCLHVCISELYLHAIVHLTPMSPVSLALLWLALSLVAAVEPADDQEASCSPKLCGNLTISEPFGFVPEQATDTKCGRLGFEVHCNNSIPYLGYYRRKYRFRILNIFYDNSSLLVADIHKLEDFIGSNSKGCHVLTSNTSSKIGLPFSISPVNLNLIFYMCTKTPEPDRGLVETK